MRIVSAAEVHTSLEFPALIEALAAMFRAGCEVPLRHHHGIAVPGGPDATLLLMPAWQPGAALGIKIVSVFPGNAAKSLPAVMGQYLLLDAATGAPKALIDGTALTLRRTAAASALASRFLSRKDSAHLLMVGTGALAPHLAAAHCAVRPIRRVTVWGRNGEHARAMAAKLELAGIAISAAAKLREAVGAADIISCATLAQAPLVLGTWLHPGQHLDLVGGFTPAMREADDDAVRRADVYVDTRAGAMKEAGDIVQPLKSGALEAEAIKGDLFDLCRGTAPGRADGKAITLFKSVGTALEDLAAAKLVAERLSA
ncbi:MAG TPA: ornithine cyclodeaminase family protein [Alphaproteobacteria bacterium]|jgi:ornithine cyclodeaminase